MSVTQVYTVRVQGTAVRFEARADESVLQAAHRQGISLPYSCGEGVCGICLCQIVEGGLAYPNGDPLALFEEDKDAGKGLICVGQPCSDLVLMIPEMQADYQQTW